MSERTPREIGDAWGRYERRVTQRWMLLFLGAIFLALAILVSLWLLAVTAVCLARAIFLFVEGY